MLGVSITSDQNIKCVFIRFNFRGTSYNAEVKKQGNEDLEVVLLDECLTSQFGSTFHYYSSNKVVDFIPLNLSHSELYILQSEIKKAIISLDRK